jgi:hypothetical protein
MVTTSKVSFVHSCSRLVMHVDRWISPKKGGQKDYQEREIFHMFARIALFGGFTTLCNNPRTL